MNKDIFISYSRRDQEFVARLAADLNERVAGVWFDQSTIQVGQKWHDEIMEGVRDCKAFVLVLSPDAAESRYVREEVNKALELGKVIIPILYRTVNLTGELATLTHDTQMLDLRLGNYTDNFHTLVDGLIEAGAAPQTADPDESFLRQPTKTNWRAVFSKIPGWAFAWGLGWLAFWLIIIFLLFILLLSTNKMGTDDLLPFFIILFGGGVGGTMGGLLAGLFTMLALRPNAPSISWKHMSPSIRIWAVSGPLGMFVSGVITTIMLAVGAISVQSTDANCESLDFNSCVGSIFGHALGEMVALIFITLFIFLLFVVAAWFLTGMFAGWLVVRHIRRLEPGITARQGWGVSTGWGCGALTAAAISLFLIAIISNLLGL